MKHNPTLLIIVIIIILFSSMLYASENRKIERSQNYNCYLSFNIGCQMSGIKSEDFIKSNYSPLLNVVIGKWFVPYLALEIGYQGPYFNYIYDDIKHYYQYYYGGAVFNIFKLFKNYDHNKMIWDITFHAGSGYFFNHVYNRPNICVNLGLQNNINIYKIIMINFKVNAIMGWDIYQNNEDILPGISIGLSYLL